MWRRGRWVTLGRQNPVTWHRCTDAEERERERRGMGGEEEGCASTLLFYLFSTRAHECSHKYTLTYTHSRGRYYSWEQMAPHKHSMKATSTVAFDTAAKNKWDQLYTLLVSRTCHTEGGNTSTPARSHTEWIRQLSASKPQIPKPATLTPSLIHDATSQLRA